MNMKSKTKEIILKITIIITFIFAVNMLILPPVDYFIAKNNINRYYKTNDIDINYFFNLSTDNIPLLNDLYENIDSNDTMKKDIKDYFKFMYVC